MCGIAGLIKQNPDASIGAMLKAIEHRGRDDEGVWTSPPVNRTGQRVCLGHRRLSIIDTSSAGHQPMLSHDECQEPDRQGGSRSFAFASEIKAILASGLIKAKLDLESLHQFLTFLWTPDPNTLFKSIKTVPPGHLLEWRDGQINVRQWWDISFDDIEEGRSEQWWQERVLETLDRVVKLEMVADVPLGSFLSGGVDSSSIVALMKQHSGGRRVGTYTIGIESQDLRYDIIPDDVEWARKVNAQL